MNCHDCIYKKSIPGNTHISCAGPATILKSETVSYLLAIAPSSIVIENKPIVTIDEHGTKKGWAYWPINFDPIWIISCNIKKEIQPHR
jgi:hypothetical protein